METLEIIKNELFIEVRQMKHLKFEKLNGEHIVTLIDNSGFEMVKGYGETVVEALNDLHSNLI